MSNLNKKLSRRSFLQKGATVASVTAMSPVITACSSGDSDDPVKSYADMKVAILADVHFHDIFGDFDFSSYNDEVTIRTLHDSVRSTRMFNENYFAFIATLEQLGEQGIKYICMVGDYSDEGQIDTLKGFNRVVKPYIEKYNFEFFLCNGNHDPNEPFGSDETKTFLTPFGDGIQVTSDSNKSFTASDLIVAQHQTAGMKGAGYAEMFDLLGEHGFKNKSSYLHYETPWGSDEFAERGLIMRNGEHSGWCPDASYLVEPMDGLWLCSVDMNIHLPKDSVGEAWDHDAKGWEDGKTHKPKVFEWLADVAQRAEEQGKVLIVFSHYPAIEYLNDSANDFYFLFDDSSYNNKRVPSDDTAHQLINAGVKLQFAGHIHVNDTAIRSNENGSLINIQTPSLAAYTPSYKLVTCHDTETFEITTHTVKDVPDFDHLFPYYQKEIDYRATVNQAEPLLEEMLEATDYRDFMFRHLKVLTEIKLKGGWAADMKDLYDAKTPLYWVMALSALDKETTTLSSDDYTTLLAAMTAEATDSEVIAAFDSLSSVQAGDLDNALSLVNSHLETYKMNRQRMMNIGFHSLCLATLYLRNGDELAVDDLEYELIVPINVVIKLFELNDADGNLSNVNWAQDYGDAEIGPAVVENQKSYAADWDLSIIHKRFAAFARIYYRFNNNLPADHFFVDLKTATITDQVGRVSLG
ncbi:metallophosphoesterase [Shewanella youngdeokensis]|uniref:Metallophosphoesterase n=1 Tax=Shewanella youngdeokensis TaxID=2999068 RepID=A0ABZ0JYS3_9GAMM|nr:metallophosphoesterase [Shewanella sp. DAU334]